MNERMNCHFVTNRTLWWVRLVSFRMLPWATQFTPIVFVTQWMVVEARRMVDDGTVTAAAAAAAEDDEDAVLEVQKALNGLGYEEAAQHVYGGMTYAKWKERHQKKATEAQMQAFQASAPIQAKHDKQLLAKRGGGDGGGAAPIRHNNNKPQVESSTTTTPSSNTVLPSNVCCQDVEQQVIVDKDKEAPTATATAKGDTREVPPYQPAPMPSLTTPLRVAVLTVSDRAFQNAYASGDLSGPAVVREVQKQLGSQGGGVVRFLPTVIVPDDEAKIQQQLKAWTTSAATTAAAEDSNNVDIILTTGGTGMSPRDVTPEATRAVLDVECPGLMSFCATECSRLQPLASLTRGTAGIINTVGAEKQQQKRTMVANLPGNPKAVGEIIPILLPLLVHAVQHM